MAGMTDSLRILITANGSAAEREFAKVGAASRRSLGMAENNAQRYSRTLTSAGVAMASFGAVALIGLGKAAQAAEEEHAALLRLETTIGNQPALVGASTDAFLDQAAALQDTTRFADDVTVSAQAMLGSFGMTEDQILELIPLVQDYAAITGTDLVTAARQVGRSVDGTNGTLKRSGVTFDEAAYSADHFAGTLEALQRRAGGFAAEEGKTLTGQIEILKNNLGDLVEGVGAGAADAFGDLANAVHFLDGAFDQLSPSTQGMIGKFLTFGAIGLTVAGGLSFVAGQLMKLPAMFAGARSALVTLSAAYDKAAISAYNFAGAMSASGSTAALTGGQIGGMAVASAGMTLALQELSSQAADAFGRLTGLFRIQVDTSFWDGFGEGIQTTGSAIAGAVGHLSDMNGEMSMTEQAAAAAAGAIDELQQEIQDYLAGAFDVPSAQRDLTQSFNDLFAAVSSGTATTDDMAAALEDVVTNTAEVVSAQAEHGASQTALNGTIDATRSRLLDARAANMITEAQFRNYDAVLRGIKPIVRTNTTTPGLPEAIARVNTYDGDLRHLPDYIRTLAAVVVNRGAFDQLVHDLDAADNRRFTMQVSVNRRAGGGPVESGAPYLVGERGPEMFVPSESGTIITAGQTAAMLKPSVRGSSVGSAGGGIVVNVNGSATKADGQAVVDALQRWQRSNGRVPVKTMA